VGSEITTFFTLSASAELATSNNTATKESARIIILSAAEENSTSARFAETGLYLATIC
jgi:hypothetical protein